MTRCSTSPPRRTSTARSPAPAEFVAANVVGVQVLLQACLDAGVRGWSRSPPTRSTAASPKAPGPRTPRSTRTPPTRPRRPAATCIARAYARTHGLNVSITRCCNNYGPYQFPEKVIPLFVTNLLDGQPVPLYGDGGNVRDWIHVDDHCRGIQLVLEQGAAGRRLPHRRRHRADQPRAHRGHPGQLRGRLGHGEAGGGPQGPRPALLARRLAAAGAGLRPPRPVRGGPRPPCAGTRRTARGGSR